MKIAHISDLHLSMFYKDSNLQKIKYLLKYAIAQKPDHIVITGDLTDNAGEKDFDILRNLFRSLGLLNSDRLSLVIGNHDIFGGPQTPDELFTFPKKCKNVNYDSKVKEFVNYFSETFDDCIYQNKENYFPFAKIIEDVLITGINSIARYSRLKNPFASNGSVNLEQFNEVIEIFNEFKNFVRHKIILVHHHFNKMQVDENIPASLWQIIEKQTMKLRKKKRLFRLFKEYDVDLVLHGHYHEQREYQRKQTRFLNSGASIKNNFNNKGFINFVDIKSSKITVNTHTIDTNIKVSKADYSYYPLEAAI